MVGGKHAKKFSIVSAWKSCQFLVYFYFTHFFYLKFFSRWQPSNCWVLCQSIKSYKFRLHASVNVHCILQKPSSYLASHSVTALQCKVYKANECVWISKPSQWHSKCVLGFYNFNLTGVYMYESIAMIETFTHTH